MYVYEIGYSDYEDAGRVVLYHKQKFTQDQFELFIEDVYYPILLNYVDEEISSHWKFKADAEKNNEPWEYWGMQSWTDLSRFYKEVAEALINKHGFYKIEPVAQVFYNCRSDDDPEDEFLRKIQGKALEYETKRLKEEGIKKIKT